MRSDDAELSLRPNRRAFRSSDGRRLLNVFEPEGRFYYSDQDAFEFRREEADRLAVPETRQATRLSMEMRRVRIMGVEVRYRAGETLSSAEHVIPLGIVEAQVDLGPDDFEEVTFFTPLIESGLPAPQHPAECSFMVYPPRGFREGMPER